MLGADVRGDKFLVADPVLPLRRRAYLQQAASGRQSDVLRLLALVIK